MNPAAVLQSYAEYETTVLTVKLRGRKIVENLGPQPNIMLSNVFPSATTHLAYRSIPYHSYLFVWIDHEQNTIILVLVGKERDR
jgi:hypothetical protein